MGVMVLNGFVRMTPPLGCQMQGVSIIMTHLLGLHSWFLHSAPHWCLDCTLPFSIPHPMVSSLHPFLTPLVF